MGKNGEELQGFFPTHQFVEKCKSIYITTGSQTGPADEGLRAVLCRAGANGLVQHPSKHLGHTRGWVLQSHVESILRWFRILEARIRRKNSSLWVARRATARIWLAKFSLLSKQHGADSSLLLPFSEYF